MAEELRMDETNQKRRCLSLALSIAVTLAATAALAASENFDEVKPGEIPDGTRRTKTCRRSI